MPAPSSASTIRVRGPVVTLLQPLQIDTLQLGLADVGKALPQAGAEELPRELGELKRP